MSTHILFTDNYQDLSTEEGFQFRFNCERCGNGYMSSYQRNMTDMAGDALRAAGNLFGGVFGRASSSAYDIQRMVGGAAHDSALRKAVEEISPMFNQCKRCGQWVCKDVCWNDERDQCVRCSPRMAHEISAIESEATINQLRNKANNDVDMTGGVNLNSAAATRTCPSCSASVPIGKKFCGDCGANVAATAKPHCFACDVYGEPGQKFCSDCGAPMDP